MMMDYNYSLRELPVEINERAKFVDSRILQGAQESIELKSMKDYIQNAAAALNKAKEAESELNEPVSNDKSKDELNTELRNAMREANLQLKNYDDQRALMLFKEVQRDKSPDKLPSDKLPEQEQKELKKLERKEEERNFSY